MEFDNIFSKSEKKLAGKKSFNETYSRVSGTKDLCDASEFIMV
jgi:hypothetical protein